MEDHTQHSSKHEDSEPKPLIPQAEDATRSSGESHGQYAGGPPLIESTNKTLHLQDKDHATTKGMEMTSKHGNHYFRLLIMAALSFVFMYILMYAMVNTFSNVLNNLNQVFMAGLMTVPMVVIELIVMGNMYPDKRRNFAIIATSVVVGLLFFMFIRQQTGIGDKQFLRSMIPHHAGAILMCQQGAITDPEIQQLCETIISSQQQEIDQMRGILDRIQQ